MFYHVNNQFPDFVNTSGKAVRLTNLYDERSKQKSFIYLTDTKFVLYRMKSLEMKNQLYISV